MGTPAILAQADERCGDEAFSPFVEIGPASSECSLPRSQTNVL
jgi:hypothetical protein